MRKVILWGIVVVILGGLLLTVIPLFLETNPPVVQEPAWDSPQTRALAVRACFDCHSNETRWPWFTRLPVGSWIAVSDTLRGRAHLNFSEWGTARRGEGEGRGGDEIREVIDRGSMPPVSYLMLHPEAVLTPAEKQQLVQGLQRSMGANP